MIIKKLEVIQVAVTIIRRTHGMKAVMKIIILINTQNYPAEAIGTYNSGTTAVPSLHYPQQYKQWTDFEREFVSILGKQAIKRISNLTIRFFFFFFFHLILKFF